MTSTTSAFHETKAVLAHYILFRHVQKARQRGWLSPGSESSSAGILRDGVTRSWEKLFQVPRAEARSWARERLEFLQCQDLIPSDSLPVLRRRLKEEQAASSIGLQKGALFFMWRLHWLYIELADAVQAGEIPEAYLPRITELLHEKALETANRILRRHEAPGGTYVDQVLEIARSLVSSLALAGAITAAEQTYLLGALSPLVQLTPGSQKGGIGSCQVCGFDIVAASACYCSQCETPHHRDCWTYNEGCAMFACRSKTLLHGAPSIQ